MKTNDGKFMIFIDTANDKWFYGKTVSIEVRELFEKTILVITILKKEKAAIVTNLYIKGFILEAIENNI